MRQSFTVPEPYIPINCEVHDELELLCMRKAEQTILYQANGETRSVRARFDTIRVRDGQEFLIYYVGESQLSLRLDKLISFTA
jgi:transcriptional antiterminator Rof (Rho-off)